MKKVWEHDFNSSGVCRKCHQLRSKPGLFNLCAVIGKEEVAKFRPSNDNDWKG